MLFIFMTTFLRACYVKYIQKLKDSGVKHMGVSLVFILWLLVNDAQ
jgi:hypothetical protein